MSGPTGQKDFFTPGDGRPERPPSFFQRLNTRLLLLTVFFVMIAEVLIFIPSVANFRLTWIEGRLNTAATVSTLLYENTVPRNQPIISNETLMALGIKSLAIRADGRSELQIVNDMPEEIDARFDLDEFSVPGSIGDAFETLLATEERVILFTGMVGDGDRVVEVVASETPLRDAMLIYARNVLILSLMISAITAVLVFWALGRIVINPVRAMSAKMLAFAADPEDAGNIIRPSGRPDEIGIAERQLAGMQVHLSETLHNRRRLADLGLAVSKINHDMRNVLSSASLISDRLTEADDPLVQRLAPKLLRSLDRAVNYTESVLAYGRAQEAAPKLRALTLRTLVNDISDTLGFDGGELLIEGASIRFENKVAEALRVEADPEQLFRAVLNVARNAVQAMQTASGPGVQNCLSIECAEQSDNWDIRVSDTGPGLPQVAQDNLFQAFRGSAKAGGTGLGLAICREIVRAHGGDVMLEKSGAGGTTFVIRIPRVRSA